MKPRMFIWLPEIEAKNLDKHHVQRHEIEEVFRNRRREFIWESGDRPGEDFYLTLGRTDDGRYLAVFFIKKLGGEIMPISARDMDDKERKRYGKK